MYRKVDVETEIARCHQAGLIVGRVLMDNGHIAAAAAVSLTPSGYQWLQQQVGLWAIDSWRTQALDRDRDQPRT
jgi:hypothetical protein